MKRLFLILGGVVAILLITALVLPFLVDVNQFRPRLEATLSEALSRQVTLGDLRLSILSGSVGASDLSIAEDPAFGKEPFIRAKALNVTVDLRPLIMQRKLNVTGFEIDGPAITLIQSSSGAWNFSSLGGKAAAANAREEQPAAAPDLSVALIRIANGRIALRRGKDPEQVLEKLDLEVRNFAPRSAFPFSMKADVQGGGSLKLDGNAGPMNPERADETPFEASLVVTKVDLVRSGFVRQATGMNGVLSVDSKIRSDGRAISVTGKVTANQLKLASKGTPASKPVSFDLAMKHDTRSRSGSLSRGNILIGKAQATLTGTYRISGDDTLLNMKLAAPAMQVDELAAMLPSLAVVLPHGSKLQGGTAMVNLTAAGPTDGLATAGSLAVKQTRLTGFDLGSQMKTVAQLAGIKINPDTDFDHISADVTSNKSGVSLQNISVLAPAIGEITGAGTVSPSNTLAFKMRARLLNSSGVMAVVGSREASIPFSIQGTSDQPKFVPDVKGIATGIAETELKNSGADEAVKAATGVINLFKRKKQE